jgi:putative transcriptional regulator
MPPVAALWQNLPIDGVADGQGQFVKKHPVDWQTGVSVGIQASIRRITDVVRLFIKQQPENRPTSCLDRVELPSKDSIGRHEALTTATKGAWFMNLAGHLLVAANHLRDPNFYRAVVVLLEHNDEGAMGLVINRPSSIAVDAALSEHVKDAECGSPIFVGGPVENSALFILHSSSEAGVRDQEIVPGVFLTGSQDSFQSVVEESSSEKGNGVFRVYCGYAGWGAEQLEAEVRRGDWMTLPGEGSIILQEDPYDIWEACTQRIYESKRLLPHNVRNPEWN